MAKPVTIGIREFRTQGSAMKHFQTMLHRYKNGQRIDVPADHADLVALIERYDKILEEVGEPAKGRGQIEYFERRVNAGNGWQTSGFWVVREDGSDTDFSYICAVKGQLKKLPEDFYNACRSAVAPDIHQFKKDIFDLRADELGRIKCEHSDRMVTFGEAHVDHKQPLFWQLVRDFRAARGWASTIPDGVVSPPADNQTTANFVDAAVEEGFRTFHNERAELRVLSAKSNLQLASLAKQSKAAGAGHIYNKKSE